MRHRKKGKTLDRKSQPRALMLRNLAASVLLYEQVTTTEAKAKAVRPLVERVITAGRRGGLTARRRVAAVLPVPRAVAKVMEELGPRYRERAGGYCRITRLPDRRGDAARLARLELV